MSCTFCIPGKEALIKDWPKEHRAGLQMLMENGMVGCEEHKKEAGEKLKTMPKVYELKQGKAEPPAAFMPKPVAAPKDRYERDPGQEG